MSVSVDRWTCPDCRRTVVIDASPADVQWCIKAAQKRHADAHRAAAVVVARMNFPTPLRPAKRRAPDTGRRGLSA